MSSVSVAPPTTGADVLNVLAARLVREFVEGCIKLRHEAEALPADEKATAKVKPSTFTSLLASIDSTFGGYLALEITPDDYAGEAIFPTTYAGTVISRRLLDEPGNVFSLYIAMDDTPEIVGNPYFECVIDEANIPLAPGEHIAADALLGRRVEVGLGDYYGEDSHRRIANYLKLI